MTALEKYIWIVRTLYNKGDRGLSLKELNDKWIHDETISNGEPLPRQAFDRWKGNILMILGVNIECRLKGGNRYYISNPECLSEGGLVRWLLDTLSKIRNSLVFSNIALFTGGFCLSNHPRYIDGCQASVSLI